MIDKKNGKEIISMVIPFMPTFDGMIAANGKIYDTFGNEVKHFSIT